MTKSVTNPGWDHDVLLSFMDVTGVKRSNAGLIAAAEMLFTSSSPIFRMN